MTISWSSPRYLTRCPRDTPWSTYTYRILTSPVPDQREIPAFAAHPTFAAFASARRSALLGGVPLQGFELFRRREVECGSCFSQSQIPGVAALTRATLRYSHRAN
jgi:hypothetical protein